MSVYNTCIFVYLLSGNFVFFSYNVIYVLCIKFNVFIPTRVIYPYDEAGSHDNSTAYDEPEQYTYVDWYDVIWVSIEWKDTVQNSEVNNV
jgi:hypothetical protein